MNDDLIKRASGYLARTHGITDGEWSVVDDNGLCDAGNVRIEINGYKAPSLYDLEAIRLTNTARELIQELVGMVQILERQIFLNQNTPSKRNGRTNLEWRQTYWETTQKIHPELNINTATSCDVAIVAICKIDDLTQENQVLKNRLEELKQLEDLSNSDGGNYEDGYCDGLKKALAIMMGEQS